MGAEDGSPATLKVEREGTHWVLKGGRTWKRGHKFLMAPGEDGWWTEDRDKAGVWSLEEAERLAAIYGERPEASGELLKVWAEWIGLPGDPVLRQ